MSDRGLHGAVRYLPHVIVTTTIVAVVPILVVWMLRDHGVISSPWVGVPIAVLLSLLAAVIGDRFWRRHRSATDLMFGDLLLWGWLRRLYVDHKVERAVRLLSGARPGERRHGGERTVRKTTRLLSQLATALEAQDPYLGGHSRRVARHATMIAQRIGLSGEEVRRIRVAAVVHDVGKLCVPRGILNKPGRLTPAEFDEVKPHANEGAALVACVHDAELTAIVRHHHERLDGSGYPAGLRGEQIPLGARILAVADTYDAIAAPRPYRPAATREQAFDTLRHESDTHLDPALVRAFRSCYSGKRPLAFWESVAACVQAAWFLPRRRGGIEPHLSASGVVGSTVPVSALVIAVIVPPIGVRLGEHRPAPLAAPPPLAATADSPRHSVLPAPARRRVPGPASRSTGMVAHVALPADLNPARHGETRPASRPRGVAHGVAQGPTSSDNLGATPPTKRPPTLTQPRPPAATPSPIGSSPPTRAPVRPPVAATPPASPGTTTTNATTPPTPAPTSSPSAAPVSGSSPPTPAPTSGPSTAPVSKDQCKKSGYTQYGFPNQGQCVASVEHQR